MLAGKGHEDYQEIRGVKHPMDERDLIRDILAEGIRVKERKNGKKTDRSAEYCRLLELVGLDETFLDRFPHELSGGQLQRVCIARAVACEPEFILFDEAISSLDAHTQVQVMDLLKELKEKLGLTYVFITHDLTSVTYLCDEVMFLYKGTDHGTYPGIPGSRRLRMCMRESCWIPLLSLMKSTMMKWT